MSKQTDMGSSDLLFVYGTLRRTEGEDQHPKSQFLHANTTYLDTGKVQGTLYRMETYPALTLGNTTRWVTGDVVKMDDPDAIFAQTDAFEEYGQGYTEPWEYHRILVPVHMDNGVFDAWAYVYNWPTAGLPRISSGDWLKR